MRKFLLKWLRRCFGSLFFLGYIPLFPGTIGSLVVVFLLWYFNAFFEPFFQPQQVTFFWLSYLVFLIICIFLSNNAEETFGSDDPKQIIIDECAGQLITFFLLPISWRVLILGFFLFRFYDIVKPFPVNKFEEIEDGVGVVMDDVVAGIMANVSLFIILWLYHAIKAYL